MNTFEYRKIRAVQICTVFVTTLVIERILNFEHEGWVGFFVMMIYVGFDSGASIHRTMHRFWGTIFGLLLSYFLWILGILDFRLEIIIIIITLFFSFFLLNKFYAFPTIFTVSLTFLGTAYFTPQDYHPGNFFFDYFRATVMGFFICLLFEGLIFKKSHLTQKFYQDLQASIIQELENLYDLSRYPNPNKNRFLKGSAACRVKINELRSFEGTLKYGLDFEQGLDMTKIEDFHRLVGRTLHDIRLLFLLPGHFMTNEIIQAIQYRLIALKHYLQ